MINIILFLALLLSIFNFANYIKNPKNKVPFYVYLLGLIKGYSFDACSMIIAQARHESNNFESDLYERAKNPFGMRTPKVRKSYGIKGTSNTYAVYRSYYASVVDYFLRANEFEMPKNLNDYISLAEWLKSSKYYTDSSSNYASRINYWSKQYPANKMHFILFIASISIMFILFIVLIFTLRKSFKSGKKFSFSEWFKTIKIKRQTK
jgi:hypothetical protein